MSDTLRMSIAIQDERINYDFLPPNVFTPNSSDDINETYFVPDLPGNNCERQFKNVVIYNRYGVEVYSSAELDFHWDGEDHPTGVYYYLISYTDFSIKGTLSILR
jgi:gliding motility-associated-like protein